MRTADLAKKNLQRKEISPKMNEMLFKDKKSQKIKIMFESVNN